ncbi:hypothetical protein LTR17_026623 [Elasticomyces elasticus]|nr:hypothetical protein LTR17_026623 [Elasticomyces elasticus]
MKGDELPTTFPKDVKSYLERFAALREADIVLLVSVYQPKQVIAEHVRRMWETVREWMEEGPDAKPVRRSAKVTAWLLGSCCGKTAMSRQLLNIRYRQKRLLWYTLCYERGFLHKLMKNQIVTAENAQSLIRHLQEMWLFGQLDTLGDSKVQQQNDEHAKSIAELLKQLADLQKSTLIAGRDVSTSQPEMANAD